jgi:hypothetical protein
MKSRKRNRFNDFKEICDKIKSLFMFNSKTSPMTLTELCKKLIINSENIRSNFNEGNIFPYVLDVLKKVILKLKDIIPNWLKIREHSILGTIVLLDNTPMPEVFKKLDENALDELEEFSYDKI